MNKVQFAQLASCRNTRMTLDDGMLIWQGHPTFVANVNTFNKVFDDIIKYKEMQDIDVRAAEAYKQKLREDMAFKSIKIRSAVQNFAKDTGDIQLYDEINISPSELIYKKQEVSLTKAEKIEKIARDHLADIAPYKVLLADVDAYAASVQLFADRMPLVKNLIANRITATQNLKVLLPEIRQIVHTQLKNGVTQFMDTAPDFYKTLLNTFKINNFPTHYTEFDMVLLDKETREQLFGVKVTAVASNGGEMVQYSNPVGEVDFKQFEPDYWDLTYELPGYEPVVKKKLKAELGKKINIGNVLMVKTV